MSSQEQRPIRSRRELRRAREENQAPQAEATPPQVMDAAENAVTGRNRRAADAPVDAVGATAQERSSQIRARDRAALRAIKELADKEEQLSGGGPPTRRQLRLQQLQAEVATSANPIVPMPGGKPADKPAGKPVDAKAAPDAGAKDSDDDSAASSGPAESEMSVEQALAVRELIAAQVQNQTAKLEHIAEQDPLAVDPEVLAQQIALAERAAVLNKRAAAKQKLAEQNQAEAKVPAAVAGAAEGKKSSGVSVGPSTANNLAMVTPLEFVKVPGIERPVMKRPSTTFVPLVTSSGPTAGTGNAPANGRGTRGRSGVLARAEAVARNARKRPVAVDEQLEETQRPPIAASAAYGLDPLDANTAGLARAQRNRLLQLGVLALGVVALIVGIIMITSG
jgi:hypothetical protein